MKVAGLLDENKTKELTRATFFRSLFLGSEIQSQAYSQYLNMLASQGQGYSPFISSEVNKAMSNLIASQKPIHDLLRLTMEKATTNILIQTETSVDKHSNTFVTADEAVRIIKSEGPSMVESEELLLAKRAQLLGLPEGLPNINARTQDLTSIGLKNAPITTNEQSNNLALAGQLGTENEGTSTADRHRKRASDEVEDFEDFMA